MLSRRTLLLCLLALVFRDDFVSCFISKPSLLSSSSRRLFVQHDSSSLLLHSSNSDTVDSDMPTLNERIQRMKVRMLEDEMTRPPNAKLGPTQFVVKVLEGLLDPYDPVPDAGFRRLLRASTPDWRARMYHAIGAPTANNANVNEEAVASALGAAISRPHQQFGILVGTDDAEDYYVSFPTDLVDNLDGSCWLEARLYGTSNDELLVIMGWNLKQRQSDGAWLIDGMDWQDFRDAYRPGLGREEWERICG